MKKILFVGDSESIHLKRWVDYFCDSDRYSTYLASFSLGNITNCKNVFQLSQQRVNISGGNYHYILSIPKLAKILETVKPDIINAHYSYSMGFVSLLALKYSGLKSKLSVVCHGSDVLDTKCPIYDKINYIVLKNSSKIVSVSSQITDRILNMQIDARNIFTGQYGIFKHILTQCKSSINKPIDIISNRSYVPNSRIDELLQAINSPFFYDKKIVFILPHISPDRLQELRAKYSFITFYEGLSHSKILDLILKSKVYISATKSDGSSLSLLEALGGGAYPVVSNIPSNREWVIDGLNGSLFHNFKELYTILETILSQDNEYFENIKTLNLRMIGSRAVYEHQMKKIEDFLFQDYGIQ